MFQARPNQIESPIEEIVRLELTARGIEFLQEYQIDRGDFRKYYVDFLLPEYGEGIIIECDGHEYHSSPPQKLYDQKRTKYLNSIGYRVIRLTGREIYLDVIKAIDKVMRIIIEGGEKEEELINAKKEDLS